MIKSRERRGEKKRIRDGVGCKFILIPSTKNTSVKMF